MDFIELFDIKLISVLQSRIKETRSLKNAGKRQCKWQLTVDNSAYVKETNTPEECMGVG